MMTAMQRVRIPLGLSLLLGLACTSHNPHASPVAAESESKHAAPEPVGATPRIAVPGSLGEVAPERISFDGRGTADTSAERHTEAKQGLAPIAARLPGERIEVASVREFVAALGSDRTIVMKPGVYVWRDGDVLGYSDGVESYDELSEHWRHGTIVDVENLTIAGLGTGARILQPDGYDHVLAFQDVRGLTLYNLVLGHHVERGGCAGGVVRIIGGRDVVIDGLEMFGSGTEGLTLSHVQDVEVRHCVVWGCSEQLSTIFDAKNVRIHDTVFRDNGPDLLRGFNLGRAEVHMQRVTIRANRCGDPMQGYGTLFSDDSDYSELPGVVDHGLPKIRVTGPQGVRVTFEDGVITDNHFDAMSDRAGSVHILRSTVERSGLE